MTLGGWPSGRRIRSKAGFCRLRYGRGPYETIGVQLAATQGSPSLVARRDQALLKGFPKNSKVHNGKRRGHHRQQKKARSRRPIDQGGGPAHDEEEHDCRHEDCSDVPFSGQGVGPLPFPPGVALAETPIFPERQSPAAHVPRLRPRDEDGCLPIYSCFSTSVATA